TTGYWTPNNATLRPFKGSGAFFVHNNFMNTNNLLLDMHVESTSYNEVILVGTNTGKIYVNWNKAWRTDSTNP
ncbi:MAG: hypothetical protein WCP55_21885, partial [Lentisphaerota bacterium]